MGILQARLKRSTILEVSENFRITIIVNATPLINLDYKILFAGVSNPSVTESLLQFLKKLIYRFIMFLVTGCSFFFILLAYFAILQTWVDRFTLTVQKGHHPYCLVKFPVQFLGLITYFCSFTYLSFRYAQDWYFLRFVFPVRSFCYRDLSFFFSTPIICKLGVTWALI